MTTTLLRIRAHLGAGTRVVVWAHNSHVGDSTATGRGGVSFDANETWNLGQMVRATFRRTWVVGQYTHRGTVTAAPKWGAAHSSMALHPATPESYEGALHRVAVAAAAPSFFFRTAAFAAATAPPVVAAALSAGDPLACGLAAMLGEGDPPRPQRWVGVSYKPATEQRSHYGDLSLSRCYDAVVFLDETRALSPIARPGRAGSAGAVVASAGGAGGGGGAGATKRLLKEYRKFVQRPPAGLEAHPLESNLLEWHFVIRPTRPPYAGGEYHGSLEFPPLYPMRPPAFRMFTPSGRFEPGELEISADLGELG